MKEGAILQILGGGRLQKGLIQQAESQGISVIVVDKAVDAPGKRFASYSYNVSTTDLESNLKIAKEKKINGILTIGTDQPVLITARIAESLNLPTFISSRTALLATNKELMKRTCRENNIHTPEFIILDGEQQASSERVNSLRPPLVVKPADSQGQRGVALVNNLSNLHVHVKEAIGYSKSSTVIIEEYCNGYEITANAWVHNGTVHLLALTDRVTYLNPPTIGICLAHIYPSKYVGPRITQIKDFLQKIIHAFGIEEGPLYIQLLITPEGPLLNELACRIGGGHEDELIPAVTGIDVRQWLIDFALKGEYDFRPYEFSYEAVNEHYGVFFIAVRDTDVVEGVVELRDQVKHPDLIWGEFYIKKGDRVRRLHNATDRVGAFILRASDRESLLNKARKVYSELKIRGRRIENLVEDIFSLNLINI